MRHLLFLRRLFLLWMILTAGGISQLCAETSASPARPKSASELPITSLVRESFGTKVSVVEAGKSTVLKGDFNGDGFPDIAVLVKPTGKRGELAPGVRLVQTAEGAKDPAPNSLLTGKNSLAMIHGGSAGWQPSQSTGKYLIDSFGWIGWNGPQTGDLVVLPKSRQARDKLGYATISPDNYVSMPKSNKGDAIVVPTEAGIHTLLYWNGTTYRFWVDPGDTP